MIQVALAAGLCSSDTSMLHCRTPAKPSHGDSYSEWDTPPYSSSPLAVQGYYLISPEALNNHFSNRWISKLSGRKDKRHLKELLVFWCDESVKLSRVTASMS